MKECKGQIILGDPGKTTTGIYLEVSENWGHLFGGPSIKDCSMLGYILGSPYSGKLPLLPSLQTTCKKHPTIFSRRRFPLFVVHNLGSS